MDDPHLNRDVLVALQEVMEDEYPVLLDTFLVDSEERLNLLHLQKDAGQLMETAHSFKGSSSNMGAARLADLCHELEHRAKECPSSELAKLIGEIDREFAVVRPLYEAERQRSLSEKATARRF